MKTITRNTLSVIVFGYRYEKAKVVRFRRIVDPIREHVQKNHGTPISIQRVAFKSD